MNTWNLPTDDYKGVDHTNFEEKLFEPLPEPPKPIIETKLMDVDPEEKKTYIEPTPHREREKKTMNEPVNIYETGFREDTFNALIDYFKKKREMQKKHEFLRQKLGWK